MDDLEREPAPTDGPQPASRLDAWSSLRCLTDARIALGRAGGSWRTETLLNFRLAHAQARDAVSQTFDVASLDAQLRHFGYETARLTTAACSQALFLKRPDLGRQLSDDSRQLLMRQAAPRSADSHVCELPHPGPWAGRNLAIFISDGLSALAAERQAVPTLAALLPLLARAGWTRCPIFLVPFARVKLQDEIGALLRVRHTLALLGERPGLGSPDSLGAYFTYQPGPEKTDADRNCVSNIRPQGLPPHKAGLKLAHLLIESAKQACSGVGLKDVVAEKPDFLG